MFAEIKVFAANYEMVLVGDGIVKTNENSDIYVRLKNINISEGLNVCEGKLEYDSTKLTVNSISGENGWNITNGDKIIFDNSNSIKSDSNISKINISLKDDTTLKITNINCTDGENEYPADDYILNLNLEKSTTTTTTTKVITTTIVDDKNNNSSNSAYKSSTTTEQKSTGVKEYCLIFIVISLLTYMIFRIVKKKDIFKKI